MADLNRIFLIGHAGRDATLKELESGEKVSNFSLAVTKKWKNKNKENCEKTDWFNVVAWGRLADICESYVFKGKRCFVEGEIQLKEWEDRDGAIRSSMEVVIKELILLSPVSNKDDDDDDIPF